MKEHINIKGKITDNLFRIVLLIYSAVVAFPLIWSFYSSFKKNKEFYGNPWKLPESLHIENYITAFTKAQMGKYFINSIIYTLIPLLLIVVLSVAMAYVITRYKNTYTAILEKIFILGLFLPVVLGLVPLFLLLSKMHLLGTSISIILVYTAYSLPFSIFILLGFFKTMPREYEEAAFVDGCSNTRMLASIIVPMAKSAIVTISIFNFLGLWNQYILAQTIITNEKHRTLPVGLVNLMEVQKYSTDWGALFAGLVIVMLPTLIVYVILQEKITAGLNVGGLKG